LNLTALGGGEPPLLYDTDIQKTSLAGYCIDQIGVGMKLSDQPAGHGVFGQSHGQIVAVGHHGKTAFVIGFNRPLEENPRDNRVVEVHANVWRVYYVAEFRQREIVADQFSGALMLDLGWE